MHEQVVAERHAELQIPEKAQMSLGQRLGKSLAPSLCRRAELREPLRVDAVEERMVSSPPFISQ